MQKIQFAGLKLNKGKCEFRKHKLEYFGHIISEKGISPNTQKIKAILNLKAPQNGPELQRVIGMVNYSYEAPKGRCCMVLGSRARTGI